MNDAASAISVTGGDLWQRALRAQTGGDFACAAALFLACLEDPAHEHAMVHFHVAWCLENAHQRENAVAHYEQVLARSVDQALAVEALFRLAWLAIQDRAIDRARPLLARALSLADTNELASPTLEHARYWFAVCLEADGEVIEACARYEAIAGSGNPDLWHEAAFRRVLCLSQIGNLIGALAAAEVLLNATGAVHDRARLRALQEAAREEREQIARALAAA
jgi:tetratricopeptide (TPR) repeat protein